MLYKDNILLLIYLIFITIGCSIKNSAMYISIEGQEYSKSELYIDGYLIGKSEQTLIKMTGEFYIDGKFIDKDTSNIKLKKGDNYIGHFKYFTISSGKHRFLIISDTGKKVEFEKIIKSGENYVILRIEKDKILWNNEEIPI